MYKQLYNIGDLSSRPVVETWDYNVDVGGGLQKTLSDNFYVWAKIDYLTGGFDKEYGKYNWLYGMKMVVRHNAAISSASTVLWNSARWMVKSIISVDDRFSEILCEKSETQLVTTNVMSIYFYNYDAAGGEMDFVNLSLIGKTVFGVYKDGTAKQIITAGSPNSDQCKYESATGTFTFGVPFYTDEKAIIQYA